MKLMKVSILALLVLTTACTNYVPVNSGKSDHKHSTKKKKKEPKKEDEAEDDYYDSDEDDFDDEEVNDQPQPRDPLKGATRLENAGLRNIGNTCFLNSSLKALFTIPTLPEILQDPGIQKIGTPAAQAAYDAKSIEVRNQLNDILETYNDSLDGFVGVSHKAQLLPFINSLHMGFELADLHNKIKKDVLRMKADQLDATEFTTELLDFLNYPEASPKFSTGSFLHFVKSGNQRLSALDPLSSIIPLDFGQGLGANRPASVQEALNNFLTAEDVQVDDGADKNAAAKKRMILFKPDPATYGPDARVSHLIFGLKRTQQNFGAHAFKDQTPLEISQSVSVPVFERNAPLASFGPSANKVAKSDDVSIHKFKLSAVVVHRGPGAHGGHYVAYTRLPGTNTWLLHNDRLVHRLTEKGAKAAFKGEIKTNAYMMVYVDRDADQNP